MIQLELTQSFSSSWANYFVAEVSLRRHGLENTLLIYDGYACRIQYRVLKLFKENTIFVVCLPVHLSYVLQPQELTVFSLLKAHLERRIHYATQ